MDGPSWMRSRIRTSNGADGSREWARSGLSALGTLEQPANAAAHARRFRRALRARKGGPQNLAVRPRMA